MNLVAYIDVESNKNIIGRIGGNIPEYFMDKSEDVGGNKFYLTFQHPDAAEKYISVFVAESYDDMLDNNIYPHCAVKVFLHPFSAESNITAYTIDSIKKSNIVGYDQTDEDGFNFITKTNNPRFIQDEDYYYEELEKDGYEFFIQIDEDFYPDDLIGGDYIFGYGALYLYKNDNGDVLAGFWQYS